MKCYDIKYLFLVIITLITVSCREHTVRQKEFSFYEGTEYIISIISNTRLVVHVGCWDNVNIPTNTEYSETQSAEIVALLLPILKKCTPYLIRKRLTYDEQTKEFGIPPPLLAPTGNVWIGAIADNDKYISIFHYDDHNGKSPQWDSPIHIFSDEFIMTYKYNDAVQIRKGIEKILKSM